MPPEQLAALAQALGVEATPEAVLAALQQLMQQLQAAPQEGEAAAAVAPMMSALRSAFGLGDDDDLDIVITSLQGIAKRLESQPEGYDFAALKGFVDSFGDEPQDDPIPAHVGDSSRASKHSQSRRFSITGKAAKPGIIKMLQDIRAAKAQSYQIGPSGGYILNHEVAADILPVLRDSLPLFDMGVQEYNMDGVESLTIPKDRSEHSAYWVGEGTTIPDSEETVGAITLYPRPLAARVIVPNKFLANSIMDYESRVREKITYQLNRALMSAALFGTGGVSGSNTGAQPAGLVTLSGVSGRAITSTSLGANGARPKIDDLTDAFGRIEDANVDIDDSAAFLFAPRTKRTFANLKTTDGQPLLRESWASAEDGQLLGYDWETSNLIPTNLTVGSNSDNSYIFAGVWSQMALGISNQFEFMVDPYSLSSSLQTVIIASTYADMAVLYDEAFEIITGVRP